MASNAFPFSPET